MVFSRTPIKALLFSKTDSHIILSRQLFSKATETKLNKANIPRRNWGASLRSRLVLERGGGVNFNVRSKIVGSALWMLKTF